MGRRRGRQLNKAAPQLQPRVTFTAEQVAALVQQGNTSAAPAAPLARPEDWFRAPFGPGTPLIPAPINAPRPDTHRPEPRLYDYPVSWNLQTGGQRLVPWETLRAAGDAPLIRQCIQVRKRGITDLGWDITISQGAVEALQADGAARADAEQQLRERLGPDIARLVAFWTCPDRGNGLELSDWLGSLLEEHLVLDAVAIYPRLTYGGDMYSVELLDGSTIKPLLDDRGGRPVAPYPAFQQILHGFPRGEWMADAAGEDGAAEGMTADQLIYRRYTVRTWTPYGYSQTEQALVDMDVYLRRLGWMRDEYTPGVQAETWMKIPPTTTWNAEQLQQYERALNDDFSSNRARIRFTPPGAEPDYGTDTGERYKPDYDLHLIKLVASHFGVTMPELGFSEAKGLGSSGWSEGQEAVQHRQAVLPTARWLEALLTGISRRYLAMPAELEFRFLGLEDQDEKEADEIAASRVASGRMTLNEDRDRQGLPRYPLPEADKPALHTGTGLVFVEGTLAAQEASRKAAENMARQAGQDGGQPGKQEPPNPGLDHGGTTDSGQDEEQAKLAAAEVAAFQRWIKKNPKPARPFAFKYATPADVGGWTPYATFDREDPDDPDDELGKAGGVDPKGRRARWPGWEHDQALARIYGPLIAQALAAAVDPAELARRWLEARGQKAAGFQDARTWLDSLPVFGGFVRRLQRVLRRLWPEAWLVGDRSAQAQVTMSPPDWGDWEPGDAEAAERLYGGARGLQDLLDRDGITTIKAIAQTRMNQLAARLADAVAEGWSVDHLADEIRGLLSIPERAEMIATTEIARAISAASLDRYRDAGLEYVEWDTAYDKRVCKLCRENEDAGPIRIGQPFPAGAFAPPQHPHCRCAPQPVLDPPDAVKAGGADRNAGNAEQLRHWYVRGEGAARIGWGTHGDFERCVAIAGEHMANPQGYCANRHREATGEWPGRGREH